MNKTTFLIAAAATVLMAAFAFQAFADPNTIGHLSGNNNDAYQDSFNTHVGDVNNGTFAGGKISNTNTNVAVADANAKATSGSVAVADGGKGGNASTGPVHVSQEILNPKQHRIVASAASNFLTAAPGTCLGSATGSIQTGWIGIGGGSTTESDACNAREDFAVWMKANQPTVAIARLCQVEAHRRAIEDAGVEGLSCPGKKGDYAPAAGRGASNDSGECQPWQRGSVFNAGCK